VNPKLFEAVFRRKCKCRWLERWANDPTHPIVFDERLNEFQIVQHDHAGYSMIYYCPFCGGKAPKSVRQTLWTEVTQQEAHRLHELTSHIQTSKELFATFGEPDRDYAVGGGSMTEGTDTCAPEVTVGERRVVYLSLSDTAEVHVRIDRYDRLRFSFMGRYLGEGKQ